MVLGALVGKQERGIEPTTRHRGAPLREPGGIETTIWCCLVVFCVRWGCLKLLGAAWGCLVLFCDLVWSVWVYLLLFGLFRVI